MKKFAANYVVSESGDFLKNSILIAEDDGTVLDYIDTNGHLEEMAQLTFHNGILMANFTFAKVRESMYVQDFDPRFSSLFMPELDGKKELSILNWLSICKKAVSYFPDIIIMEIFKEITRIICVEGGFRKEFNPGIYLLTGSDLVVLKLTENCKLKRIL